MKEYIRKFYCPKGCKAYTTTHIQVLEVFPHGLHYCFGKEDKDREHKERYMTWKDFNENYEEIKY